METYSAEEIAEATNTDLELIEEGDRAARRLSSTETVGDTN